MLYNIFNFKSLKIALAKTGADNFIGYSVDSKYPEFSRAIIRGSAKDVVEQCIYLYQSRLRTAYNCEDYNWDIYGNYAGMSLKESIQEWAEYVLNRYLFGTFNMYYEHIYKIINYSYIASDGTPCSLDDYVEDDITIQHWE